MERLEKELRQSNKHVLALKEDNKSLANTLNETQDSYASLQTDFKQSLQEKQELSDQIQTLMHKIDKRDSQIV